MAFYTILTDIGKAKLANATALGTTVSLQDIAVGDGGGVAVTPQTSDTALTNEVWRAALNNISIDSSNANWIVCEGYIPSDVGDFTIREVGLFDADGDMIAVGNYPDTYKPTLASGSAKDLYIKVIIEVSDAGVVELKIDPAVVLATRKYVDDETAKRALLQGDNTLTFKVADAVNADEALSRQQLVTSTPLVGSNTDLLDGKQSDVTAVADTIPVRDADTAIAGQNQCTAWAYIDGVNATIIASYNISSIVKNAAGQWAIYFENQMTTNTYCAVVQENSPGSHWSYSVIGSTYNTLDNFQVFNHGSTSDYYYDVDFSVVVFGGK